VVVGQESLDVLAGELGQAADLGVGSRQGLGVLVSSRSGARWQRRVTSFGLGISRACNLEGYF